MGTTLTRDSIDELRNWLSDKNKSANTIKAYSTDILGFWNDEKLTEILVQDLETRLRRWLRGQQNNWSTRTQARKTTAAKAYCLMVGIQNPLSDYALPTPSKSEAHPLPGGWGDIEKMLAVCVTEEQKLLVVLTGMVGLRINEALRVTISDFDFHDLELKVNGKGNKDRVVPISDLAWEYISSFVTESFLVGRVKLIHYSDRGARKLITSLGKRANLTRNVASHDLRATFATETLNAGANIRTVQELLGHAHVTTTEGYTGVTRTQMRQAVNGWKKS